MPMISCDIRMSRSIQEHMRLEYTSRPRIRTVLDRVESLLSLGFVSLSQELRRQSALRGGTFESVKIKVYQQRFS